MNIHSRLQMMLHTSPAGPKTIPLNFKRIRLLYVQWATSLHVHNRFWKPMERSSAESIFGSVLRLFNFIGLRESKKYLARSELLDIFQCDTVYKYLSHLMAKGCSKKYAADQVCNTALVIRQWTSHSPGMEYTSIHQVAASRRAGWGLSEIEFYKEHPVPVHCHSQKERWQEAFKVQRLQFPRSWKVDRQGILSARGKPCQNSKKTWRL